MSSRDLRYRAFRHRLAIEADEDRAQARAPGSRFQEESSDDVQTVVPTIKDPGRLAAASPGIALRAGQIGRIEEGEIKTEIAGNRSEQIGLQELHDHAVRRRDLSRGLNRLFGDVEGEITSGDQSSHGDRKRADLPGTQFEDALSRLHPLPEFPEENEGREIPMALVYAVGNANPEEPARQRCGVGGRPLQSLESQMSCRAMASMPDE